MALSFSNIQPVQAALGQYVTVRVRVTSDQMLTGKVLRFWPATYTPGTVPTTPAFQVLYPASPFLHDMTNLGCKNYTASINVINASSFVLNYSFFVSKNFTGYFPISSYQNSSVLSLTGANSFDLSLHVKIEDQEGTAIVPISVNQNCNVEFINDGFTPGVDLPVKVQVPGAVSNNFYVALINSSAIDNQGPIVPGLISNYAKVGAGISQVDTLPYSCFLSGVGFLLSTAYLSTGRFTITGSCLSAGSSYKVLVIYQKNGEWLSCLSGTIEQIGTHRQIVPTGTSSITDSFGNAAENCASGLSNLLPIDICFELDTADFQVQLEEAGLSGSFEDYYHSTKCFTAASPEAVGGTIVQFDESAPGNYCANEFSYTQEGTIYLIFQIRMDYPDHSDYINVPFQLTYNAVEMPISVQVTQDGDVVEDMCEIGEYALDTDLGDCNIFQSVNGGGYTEQSVLEGNAILVDNIPDNSSVCLKLVCPGGLGEGDDCGCLESAPFTLEYWYIPGGDKFYNIVSLLPDTISVNGTPGNSDSGSNGSVLIENDPRNFDVTIITEHCLYAVTLEGIQATELSGESPPTVSNYTAPLESSDCEDGGDEEPLVCENSASLNFTTDEDTGEITIDVQDDFGSEVDQQDLLCSFDGGVTFIPCPSVISGEESVYITYDVTFTDGCEPIHLEQVIAAPRSRDCENSREMELSIASDQLVIALTDEFDSDVLSDVLKVSIDNGTTFQTFDPASSYSEIDLEGGEQIVVTYTVVFEDSCPDLTDSQTIINDNEESAEDCAGYSAYELEVDYDEATRTFTATKTGDEEDLTVNELLWTINGADPFDANNSGLPYTDPVVGEGFFIARWKIKLPNCAEKILSIYKFGKSAKVINNLRVTGYEFTVFDIDLLSVVDPATELTVKINNAPQTYSSSAPTAINFYTINAAGKIVTWSAAPYTNALLNVVHG